MIEKQYKKLLIDTIQQRYCEKICRRVCENEKNSKFKIGVLR